MIFVQALVSLASSSISQFLRMVRPNDVIDVLIVAYVFYLGAKLVRETRAEPLVKGIVFLLIASQVSDWFNLNTINFILRNTMQVGVLALIVVFQPEFRRALEKVGRTSFGLALNSESTGLEQMTDEVVRASLALSSERIGALIAFERDTKIGDIIRTGTELDALVSSELIINIFFPNTPLHDGAVVVRASKIMAAGCLLPLTQNENLSKELGTRHRAAIGLTESSDAVVVVISEETGKISFAKDGSLSRNLTGETLKKALLKSLQTESRQDTSKLRQWKERLKNAKADK